MLVVYNIQCGDREQAFFNITSQNIQPRNCSGPEGEQVYVSIYFYKRNFWLLIANWEVPYLLDQTPLSISRRSWIVTAPPDVLNEIVTALEY